MLSLYALVGLLGYLAQSNADTNAFWVVSHSPLMSTRLDPILSPGGVSGHIHQLLGSSSLSPTYSYDNSRNGSCTTANVMNDLSNYWAPQLYRKQPGGGFKINKLIYANTYYQMRRFRMLAGSAVRNSYDESDPAQAAVSYTCLNFNAPASPEVPAFPTQQCPDGLRAQVYFPHCWDGINNWLEGSAHVAYGAGDYNGGGQCPATHPKRIMSIFFEFIYDDSEPYQAGTRVWADGDDVGYSFHGDFTNGWPQGFFGEIFSHGADCNVGFGLSDCPAIAPHYNSQRAGACNPDPSTLLVDENVGYATIPKLPGNNPVWGSTGAKKPDPNYVESANFKHVVPAMPTNWKRVGCIDEPSGARALQGTMYVDEVGMAPGGCIKFCAEAGYSLAGIEYSQECYCGNALVGTSLTKLSDPALGKCSAQCTGQMYSKGYCGGGSVLTVYQYTGTGKPSYANVTEVNTPASRAGTPAQIKADPKDVKYYTVKGDAPYTGNATMPAIGAPVLIATSGQVATLTKASILSTTPKATSTRLSSTTSNSPTSTAKTSTTPSPSKSGQSSHATSKTTSTTKAVGVVSVGQDGGDASNAVGDTSQSGKTCSRSRKRALKEFVGLV